jgi:hypothetical protein
LLTELVLTVLTLLTEPVLTVKIILTEAVLTVLTLLTEPILTVPICLTELVFTALIFLTEHVLNVPIFLTELVFTVLVFLTEAVLTVLVLLTESVLTHPFSLITESARLNPDHSSLTLEYEAKPSCHHKKSFTWILVDFGYMTGEIVQTADDRQLTANDRQL